MAVKQIPQAEAHENLGNLLLRIAKLYQIPNFDPESALLLSEWILDEYKYLQWTIVELALNKPPISKGDKSWRLTPEVIADWIEVTRIRMIEEEQRKESLARQSNPVEFPELKTDVDKLLTETLTKLKEPVLKKDHGKEIKKIKVEDSEKVNGRKSISTRKYFKIPVEDENGKLLGTVEVMGEDEENAKKILANMIRRGEIEF